jgi:hypothetical protein
MSKVHGIRKDKHNESKHRASHTGLRGSPPPWGYVHQLFLFISIFNRQLQHRAQNPSSQKDRRSMQLARSFFLALQHKASYNNLHLALQASYDRAQSIYNPHPITQIQLLALSRLSYIT